MDIEKLIERLRTDSLYADKATLEIMDLCMEAADALSTLQAENERLKSLLGESGQDLWSKENQRADRLEAENEKLRAELEQVKREKDAAASDLESVMAYRGDNLDTCQFCKSGQCYVRGGTKQCLPQWRGPKEGKENA